jgi:hypothetical protein
MVKIKAISLWPNLFRNSYISGWSILYFECKLERSPRKGLGNLFAYCQNPLLFKDNITFTISRTLLALWAARKIHCLECDEHICCITHFFLFSMDSYIASSISFTYSTGCTTIIWWYNKQQHMAPLLYWLRIKQISYMFFLLAEKTWIIRMVLPPYFILWCEGSYLV